MDDEVQLANKIRLLYEDYVNKTLDIIKESTSRFSCKKQLRNEKKEYIRKREQLKIDYASNILLVSLAVGNRNK
jgi:hypothetical protein